MKKRTTKLTRIIAVATVILGITWSCQTDETVNLVIEENDLASEGLVETKLGRKLENPYSVENMKRAYESLLQKSNGRIASEIEIETTHLYVKFFPETKEEIELLEIDSLELFNYPIDYEIDTLGDYYLEENMDYSEGQWYWTAVPVEYQFPNVQYKIIEELFLIDEEEDMAESNGRVAYSTSLLELEDEVLRITGNWEPREEDSSNARKKIRPRGRIRVWNTEINDWEGVEGVKVRTNRWFKWGHGWTNADGDYSVNKRYERDIRYSVKFENRSGFKIWNTLIDINTAKHNRGGFLNTKKYSRYGWDRDFGTGDKAWRFCTVNNAVVKYFRYCDQFNIGRPHSNLRIAARSKSDGVGAAPMLRHTWGLQGFSTHSQVANFFLKVNGISFAANALAIITKFMQPDIMINAGYSGSNETAEVYETTFHELGHASHMRKAGNSYWVKYINYIITYGSYGNGTGHNVGICALGEAWGYHIGKRLVIEEFGNNNPLTPLNAFENFDPEEPGNGDDILRRVRSGAMVSWEGWIPAGLMQDLIDNNADFLRTGFRDNVTGYSHQDLFDALDSDVRSPQQFRNRLLGENGNRDRTYVLTLFEAYFWD